MSDSGAGSGVGASVAAGSSGEVGSISGSSISTGWEQAASNSGNRVRRNRRRIINWPSRLQVHQNSPDLAAARTGRAGGSSFAAAIAHAATLQSGHDPQTGAHQAPAIRETPVGGCSADLQAILPNASRVRLPFHRPEHPAASGQPHRLR